MSDTNTHEQLMEARIDIARLEAVVQHLTQSFDEFKASAAQQTVKLDQVLLTLSAANGSWKTVLAIGGASATVGSLMTSIVSHFSK